MYSVSLYPKASAQIEKESLLRESRFPKCSPLVRTLTFHEEEKIAFEK